MELITFILVSIVIYLTYIWYSSTDSDFWRKRNVPYVKKRTPFGLILNFIVQKKSIAEIYKEVYDSYREEPNVGLFLGSSPALLLRHPDNIQAALATDFQSFSSRGIVTNPDDILADNVLFIEDYRRWKLLRQKLSPVFTNVKLKNMFYIIARCAKDFADFIQVADRSAKKFDILYTYSTASIAASVFGIDTKTNTNTMDSPFYDMAKDAVAPNVGATALFALGHTWPKLLSFFKFKQFGAYEKFFLGVVKNVLESRRGETQKRHDFIDIILELQQNGTMKDPQTLYELEPTDEIMAAQAFFFFIAGADTSAASMHFTLIELANNPHILERVHKEIDGVFKECGDNLAYEDIDKLVYLDMVVKEAMRKYPPVGIFQRCAVRDTILPVGNVKIEKDVRVLIPAFALHRDEKYFPEPEKFDPERFSNENIGNIRKFTYLPFGEGNRMCIGVRFARLQVLAGLAWLLRRYTLQHQSVHPSTFEKSFFALRAPDVNFNLIQRNL